MLPNEPSAEEPKSKQWNYFPSCSNNMSFTYQGEDLVTSWEATCRSSTNPLSSPTTIISNFHDTPEQIYEKHQIDWFLIDKNDSATVKNAVHLIDKSEDWSMEQCVKFLSTQANFLEGNISSPIYFRIIPAPLYTDQYQQTVFTSQILDLIPLVLRKQGTPIKEDDKRLARYQEKWAPGNEGVHKTIDLGKFERILKKFDVDLSLLSIVEDPLYESSRRNMRIYGTPCQTVSHDGQTVLETSQAILVLFQKLVVGINWKKDGCEELKRKIKQAMSVISDMKEPTFINTSCIDQIVSKIIAPCQHRTPPLLHLCNPQPAGDQTEITTFHEIARTFDLPKFRNFAPSPKPDQKWIPVWMHRLFIHVGWMIQFFGEDSRLNKVFVHNMCHLVPDEYVEDTKTFLIGAIHGRSQWILQDQ